MKKIIIFGAGPTGKRTFEFYKDICEVVAFVDNDSALYGKTYGGITIEAPEKVLELNFDYIVIASVPGYESIYQQLLELGIEDSRIRKKTIIAPNHREKAFYQYAKELENVPGECAEVGVFQGETAKLINKVFHKRKLYLFDTFCGFDERDVENERKEGYSESKKGTYSDTSVERVLSKIEYPDMCVIKKGYFPETAEDLDEVFAFVRLDVDLYSPTRAGLDWFGERMSEKGLIILHDYYTESYGGVRKAVDEYVELHPGIRRVPAGDGLSVILVGF